MGAGSIIDQHGPILLEAGREQPALVMATNIYVGNLPWSLNHDDLLQLFAKFGKVISVQVITDHETGRSRGFGFVEMEVAEEAQQAIAGLNGFLHDYRPLTVNLAKPRAKSNAHHHDGGA